MNWGPGGDAGTPIRLAPKKEAHHARLLVTSGYSLLISGREYSPLLDGCADLFAFLYPLNDISLSPADGPRPRPAELEGSRELAVVNPAPDSCPA